MFELRGVSSENSCATEIGEGIRRATLTERLTSQATTMRKRLTELDEAIMLLKQHPDFQCVIDAISKI